MVSIVVFGIVAAACAFQQRGAWSGLRRFASASVGGSDRSCYDGNYSGEAAMNSLFVSFGTHWRYHTRFGGLVAAVEDSHDKSMLRSLPFNVTHRTTFSLQARGGSSQTHGVKAAVADSKGLSDEHGFVGIAVRSLRDGCWAVVKSRSKTGPVPETISFTPDDLKPLLGKQATVDIVDTMTGPWGWLAVDDFRLTGSCATEEIAEVAGSERTGGSSSSSSSKRGRAAATGVAAPAAPRAAGVSAKPRPSGPMALLSSAEEDGDVEDEDRVNWEWPS